MNQKGAVHLLVFLLIAIVIAVLALVYFGFIKLPLPSNVQRALFNSPKNAIAPSDQYNNPFEKSSQYKNPFESYKNPFDNI